jgi:hypothetical protein
MPLSRLTHTFPLDFADTISGSEAAPVAGALVDAFLAGTELVLGAEFDAEALIGLLEGGVVDLLGGGAEAVELAFVAGAAIGESLAAVLPLRLFFGVALPVSAFAAAGCSLVVSAVAFFRLFFVVPLSAVAAVAVWSPLAVESADFFLLLFLVLPDSAFVEVAD